MRSRGPLVVACLATASFATASAEPRAIKINAPRMTPRSSHAAAAAPSSRLIFVKRCPDVGCVVKFGPEDDSRADVSSIADGPRIIGRFSQGTAVWTAMLDCVRATYAPFDIEVTDADPGNVPHFEHLVGGSPTDLSGDLGGGVGGVSPFTCDEIPNAITYTFDVWGPNADLLCAVVAQETAHAFGLEHEMNDKDPLTYLSGPLPKRFQADDTPCGEYANRACECGNATQNSYQHIVGIFGPGPPTAPSVTIKSPASGKQVQPHFVTKIDASDDVKVTLVELYIDGTKVAEATAPPYRLVAPDLAEGLHTVEARATDIQGTPASTQIEVDLGPPCTAAAGCEGDDVCVQGNCVPGPSATGGLGHVCQADTECESDRCLSDSSGDRACVESCDLSAGSCPSGFGCLAIGGGGGVCWPDDAAGCCSSSRSSGSAPIVLGLGVFALLVGRRRRS